MLKSIDTEVILATANEIHRLNTQLTETLESSQKTVHSLKGVWTGKAAETTFSAYDQFAAKYFENYRETLNNYVVFLKKAAAEGYESAETVVTQLGETI